MQSSSLYHQFYSSISKEMEILRHRLRGLIKHGPTIGAFRESILRSILRRFLPRSYEVKSGFILSETGISRQIDILITRQDVGQFFGDGEIVVVEPRAVAATIEVKSEWNKNEFEECIKHNGKLTSGQVETAYETYWRGFFSYGSPSSPNVILDSLKTVHAQSRRTLNAVGTLKCAAFPFGHQMAMPALEGWIAIDSKQLAVGAFIGELMFHLAAEPASERHPLNPIRLWTEPDMKSKISSITVD